MSIAKNLSGPTGAQPVGTRIITLPFDDYEIVIAVTESGRVLGIQEVRIKKHFLNPNQIGYVDVDDFYQE